MFGWFLLRVVEQWRLPLTDQRLARGSEKGMDLQKSPPYTPLQYPPEGLEPAYGVINGILISLLFWIMVLCLSLFAF